MCDVIFGTLPNPTGGAGAVLVVVDADSVHPRVAWSASMASGSATMTNNRAEYHGVIVGLREVLHRGWAVEVIGDSALVLHQLSHYRPPKNAALRPLYSEARRLADAIRVIFWHHHRRHHNRMADCAANAATDSHVSAQTDHPCSWPHGACIDRLLMSDIQEWRTRKLLHSMKE
jgi:ribonuclease HI